MRREPWRRGKGGKWWSFEGEDGWHGYLGGVSSREGEGGIAEFQNFRSGGFLEVRMSCMLFFRRRGVQGEKGEAIAEFSKPNRFGGRL